jgi:hypothetical protein
VIQAFFTKNDTGYIVGHWSELRGTFSVRNGADPIIILLQCASEIISNINPILKFGTDFAHLGLI